MKKFIFIDTNVFIQCRNIEQLPLEELFGKDEHIILFIPRTVLEEIDRHKQDGNSRRAKRARKANSFIRKIIFTKHTKIIIKNEKPLVEISFPPEVNSYCNLPNFLDLSRPDDRIIAEILRYKKEHPDHHVAILTHDTGPLLTGKRCGISYYIVPDSWLLPPEPDPRDKKILELENKVRELKKNYPIIQVTSADVNGKEANEFSIEVLQYDQLTESEVDEIIKNIVQKNPMKTDFSDMLVEESRNQDNNLKINVSSGLLAYKKKYIPPTPEEIEIYKKEKYPQWLEKVKKYIISLANKFQKLPCTFLLSVKISNNGNVPAENVIVIFNALGDIYFNLPSRDENQDKDIDDFPRPPKPPEGYWQRYSLFNSIGSSQLIPHIEPISSDLLIPKRRDRNAFYWKDSKLTIPTKTWKFECDEFRHKIAPKIFEVEINFMPIKNENSKCAIECLISATNLPQPIKHYINFNVTYVKADTFAKVKEHLRGLNVI